MAGRRRREAFARFQAFPWPSARRGMAADRHPRAKTRCFAPHSREPPATTAVAARSALATLSTHYATGIAHINGGVGSRQADPARSGGAVFVDLDRAVKDIPEILERYLLTEAVTPAR